MSQKKPSFSVVSDKYNDTNGLAGLDRDCLMLIMHETDNIAVLRKLFGYSQERLLEQRNHRRFFWAVSNAIISSYIRNHPSTPEDAIIDGKRIKIENVSNGQYAYVVIDKKMKKDIFQLKLRFTKGLDLLPIGLGVFICPNNYPFPHYKDHFFRGEYNGRGFLSHANDCSFGANPFGVGAVLAAEVVPIIPSSAISAAAPSFPSSSSKSSSKSSSSSSVPTGDSPHPMHCNVHFFLDDILQPVSFTRVPLPLKFYISSVHPGDEFEVLSFECLAASSISADTVVAPIYRPRGRFVTTQVEWVKSPRGK